MSTHRGAHFWLILINILFHFLCQKIYTTDQKVARQMERIIWIENERETLDDERLQYNIRVKSTRPPFLKHQLFVAVNVYDWCKFVPIKFVHSDIGALA